MRSFLTPECPDPDVEAARKKEDIRQKAMSYSQRVKPFFVEVTKLEWGGMLFSKKKLSRRVINGSLIESFWATDPSEPKNGTTIQYVFGETEVIDESIEQLTKKLQVGVSEWD